MKHVVTMLNNSSICESIILASIKGYQRNQVSNYIINGKFLLETNSKTLCILKFVSEHSVKWQKNSIKCAWTKKNVENVY